MVGLFANPYQDMEHYTLKNGLEVYLLPSQKAKNVYVDMRVNVGMAVESEEKAGISHLTEHLIFRDMRVKYRDYYDLIKEKGATYVNGYTSDYETHYVAKIDPSNASWLTETFFKMMFDKNITQEDVEVEKKALQLEIGEPDWTGYIPMHFLKKVGDFLEDIEPDTEYELYKHDFKIDTEKGVFERYPAAIYRQNNKKFTLSDILTHYKAYYYPGNMTLKIVGNFDREKIKALIESTFATVPKREGKSIKAPLYKDAVLSKKPFVKRQLPGGTSRAVISMGYKYLDNNMTEFMIIDSYFTNLADRLNRELRNKKGDTYSVYGSTSTVHNAGLGSISFSTHHEAFEKNLNLAKRLLLKESRGDISDKTIKEALENSRKYYANTSLDVDSLMYIVDNAIEQKVHYKEEYKNPYEIIHAVTPKMFKETIKRDFTPENFYMSTLKDYFLFPYEGPIYLLIAIVITVLMLKRYGTKMRRRDIRFKRRLSNIFIGIMVVIVTLIIASIASDWVEYGIIKLLDIDLLKVKYFGTPVDYFILFINFLLFMVIYLLVFRVLFGWYYAKLFITKEYLVLGGGRPKFIELSEIDSLEIVPWSIDKFRHIYGNVLFFFKKLLKVTTKEGEVYYLRAWNAKHLKEDIESFLAKGA
jgi:predicted Zn-dependent peptidase